MDQVEETRRKDEERTKEINEIRCDMLRYTQIK